MLIQKNRDAVKTWIIVHYYFTKKPILREVANYVSMFSYWTNFKTNNYH